MKENNVVEFAGRDAFSDSLIELLRAGARQLIEQAVEAELKEFMTQFSGRNLDNGRSAVVRNGRHPERQIQTGMGPITVQIPKVRAKDGQPVTFRSALVPPYVRKARSLEAAIPWLYLKGVSSGEMSSALEVLIGPEARGLSASTVSRLKQTWAITKPGPRNAWIEIAGSMFGQTASTVLSERRKPSSARWSSSASMSEDRSDFWPLRMVSENRLKIGVKCC